MNENTAPAAAARRVVLLARQILLAKAEGQFKHSGKYYLLNGRWHKIHADKPAPKGAPIAVHPHAAGQYVPAKHLTDEEWEKLKLPDENVNSGTFNKQIDKLKELAEGGHVSGILGMQFGTNTYGKKLAIIANHILGLYGSEHKVTAGQKAGEHAAVQQAPAEQKAEQQDHTDAKPAEQGPQKVQSYKDVASSTTHKLAKKSGGSTAVVAAIQILPSDKHVLEIADYPTPEEKAFIESALNQWIADGDIPKMKYAVNSALEFVPGEGIKLKDDPYLPAHLKEKYGKDFGQAAHALEGATKEPKKDAAAAAAEKTGLAMPAFEEGKTKDGVKTYYEKVGQKVLDLAAAGDVAGLEKLKADGLKPNSKGKVGNTWKGKTQNSKLLLALHEQALAHAKGSTADQPASGASAETVTAPAAPAAEVSSTTSGAADSKLAQIPWDKMLLPDSNTNAKSHNKQVAKIKAMAEAGDVAGLEAFKAGKNTYGKKQMNLAALAIAALKEDAAASSPAAAQANDEGPKEGDIKQGADGMLMFKSGRWHKVDEGAKAAGKPKKAPAKAKAKAAPAAPAPDAASPAGGIESMDSWVQTGPQGGSNPGGRFKDENGVEWYCKFPSDPDVAKSEVLAAKLYQALGIAGQDAKLITKDGKLGIASKWQTIKKASSPAELAKADGVALGFAADAWLANWDVVGMAYDNLQIGADGKAVRIDAGGSLEYRAQGGKKAFGSTVGEIDSLRDPKINPQAAAVFGTLSDADITAGVAKVLKISDAQIYALVNTYGPGDAAHKKALAETLIARKADLLAKFPKAKKEKKVTFKPEKISEPPSFLNWGGSGKSGPSSKEFLNQANEEAVQAIYAAAKTGSIEAVKSLKAKVYDKNTGVVVAMAPVLEHPSQHVKGYAQQVINEINYQLNPPKRFRFEGGHPLAALNSAYPVQKDLQHGEAVEKSGKFLVLGEPGTISLDSLALPKITYASGELTRATYSPAAQDAINQMPETQKQAIQQYTGSSYVGMNTSLWNGNPTGAAKAAAEALHTLAHDITPGTVLSRKLSVSGDSLNQILNSTGKVLQEPAIMSTSIRPSSWSGNVHLKLHVGPGVKGLWVGVGSTGKGKALSVNASEDELILPPNTRILVLSVNPSKGGDADGFGTGSSHIVEAIVLPTQSHA